MEEKKYVLFKKSTHILSYADKKLVVELIQ